MGARTLIFGYGSLLSLESLRDTLPNAKPPRPALIRGFRRDFSLLDSEDWISAHIDVADAAVCSVDVHEVGDVESVVNGVIFGVDDAGLPCLLRRERDYGTIETTAYDFHTGDPLGRCFVFSAGKRNGEYCFDSPAQESYLRVCLAGAREHGEAFYESFLRTTYIGERPLCGVPSLRAICGSEPTGPRGLGR
jgi:hypothetical protein